MTFARWIPTFLAFPLGGLIAIETVGPVEGPLSAAAGGLLAGAILGAAQWLALKPRGVPPSWIALTSAAMGIGLLLAALATDAGTSVADVVLTGVIAGGTVGAAQSFVLGAGTRAAVAWTGGCAAAWALGWFVTSQVIVDLDRGYHVFGSSGALVATLLTGLVLTTVARPS